MLSACPDRRPPPVPFCKIVASWLPSRQPNADDLALSFMERPVNTDHNVFIKDHKYCP